MFEHLVDFGIPLIPSIDALAKIIKKPSFAQKFKDTFTGMYLTRVSKTKNYDRRIDIFTNYNGKQEYLRLWINVERYN